MPRLIGHIRLQPQTSPRGSLPHHAVRPLLYPERWHVGVPMGYHQYEQKAMLSCGGLCVDKPTPRRPPRHKAAVLLRELTRLFR